MRVKVLQCDTRDIVLQLQSRNLYYGTRQEYDYESLMKNNQNELYHPQNSKSGISLCCLVNMMKSKSIGIEYEFIKGNTSDWNISNSNVFDIRKKHVCWLKPYVILEQMNSQANSNVDIFCYFDTDAWIRDKQLFHDFLVKFLESKSTIAMPEDVERSSELNAGFYAIKNNTKGKEIIESLIHDPKYEKYYNVIYHEQSALCEYYKEHKDEFTVLPMNDFNTPCGRIVRHAWLHGLFYNLIVDEVLAIFTNISLANSNDSTHSLGSDLSVYDIFAGAGIVPSVKKLLLNTDSKLTR